MRERSKLRFVPKNKKPQWPSRKAHHGLQIYAAAEKVSMTNPRRVDEWEKFSSGKFFSRLETNIAHQLDLLFPLYDRSDVKNH
jgi:hypothetical protein